MDIPTNPGPDEARAQQAPIRVSGDGIHVMKVASTFGEQAVAVDLTVRSDRSGRCDIRVTDALPEALQDNHVEFHPKYDPEHWTREADRVVYRAPIGPGVVRRTVYGVTVDDQSQLASFSTQPTVAVIGGPDEASDTAPDDPAKSEAETGFAFEGPDSTAEPGPDSRAEAAAADATELADAVTPTPAASGDGGVEAFVSEIQRRGLSPEEQTALRQALGFDGDRETIQSLAGAVGELEDEIAALQDAVDTPVGPVENVEHVEDRLDTLSDEVEAMSAALSADLDDLRTALEREVHWRSQLRDTVGVDPDEP